MQRSVQIVGTISTKIFRLQKSLTIMRSTFPETKSKIPLKLGHKWRPQNPPQKKEAKNSIFQNRINLRFWANEYMRLYAFEVGAWIPIFQKKQKASMVV